VSNARKLSTISSFRPDAPCSPLGRVRARLLGAALLAIASTQAVAADNLTFMTSWYAQAEHGGFYQALATGLYRRAGLDVTIRMGGPQVNGMQQMLGGVADVIMGYDFQVLKGLEQGMPVITVGTSFQQDLQGIMTHDDVESLAALKGRTILAAATARSTWWPWLKARYGFGDEQLRPYTFNLQPFFADPLLAQQAYLSSEPFQADRNNVKVKYFLFADQGYPPYGTTMVTTQKAVRERTDVIARFVRASVEGWKSYISDPAPGNALIRKDNTNMTEEQLAYAVAKLKEYRLLTGGDAARLGIGIMTDERWKKTCDYMLSQSLLKPEVDCRQAYTLQFVRDLKVMP
jgi:NitT/TauT family transport system substrate-binding protein